MLKREWSAGSNGKLPHLFIPSKTTTLVPEFAVKDLSLSRTAALVPEFAVKNLSLGRTLPIMGTVYIFIYSNFFLPCDLTHLTFQGKRKKQISFQ